MEKCSKKFLFTDEKEHRVVVDEYYVVGGESKEFDCASKRSAPPPQLGEVQPGNEAGTEQRASQRVDTDKANR